jgi:hypothetical protein
MVEWKLARVTILKVTLAPWLPQSPDLTITDREKKLKIRNLWLILWQDNKR